MKAKTATAKFEFNIAFLFLVSGFSALIYQVVWQRVLFATFGINSESVTVIVSVFMFGLGIGALGGGWIQQRFPRHLLHIFLALEVLIGLFGLISTDLIRWTGAAAGSTSATGLVFWTYLILALPTMFMGATLPVLVAWLEGYVRNIGKSVGYLYAFNAFGSAIAAFVTVEVMFQLLGLQASVYAAAACNVVTAVAVWDESRRIRAHALPAAPAEVVQASDGVPTVSRGFAWFALAAIGYVALSQEILWYRLVSFMLGACPEAFGFLLAAYLVGMALGALRARRHCEPGANPVAYLTVALLAATVVFYLAAPAVALMAAWMGKDVAAVVAYLAVGVVAYLTGGVLPALVHLSANSARSMSHLYFANIVGSTLGPLLTGFVLLDLFTLQENIAIVTGLTLLLVMALAWQLPGQFRRIASMAMAVALSAAVMYPALFDGYLEKLQYGVPGPQPFKAVLENRSGILTVEANHDGDTMYGGGMYDGRFNLDPLMNSNMINRAYMVAGLHRAPSEVLEIGLSTGSWAKVLANYDKVKSIDIVEINKGYPAIMARYPEIADVLQDPKVTLHIDDGRRWLRNHPERKFDFILMNTSFFWRSNMTNLLSVEFLQLARAHLKPGGVIYYNSTGSAQVEHTATQVFRHVRKYANFVAASDSPFDIGAEERRANLLRFAGPGGVPVFAKDAAHMRVLERLTTAPLKVSVPMKNVDTITDDNMATEFRSVHSH